MNRRVVLALALVATLAAVWWAETPPPDEPVLPAARPAASKAVAVIPAAPEPKPAEAHARFPEGGSNLFPVQSFRPPPAPVVLPPPPPPQAPPVPFRYLGRWLEGGVDNVFLAEGDQVRTVRRGDRLGPWRVDDVRTDSMTLTYTPLDQQRTLRLAP
jgi:hypothetical protein